ncbi:MAG TPA: hypothetical protein VFC37_10420 [Terracidiphilus sp.]|jgi:Fe2+ or Zn2+ uptake regulation protein|nr:hypothetical protein [Terracidiphilus sp.]
MKTIEFLKSALAISASGATAAAVISHFATRQRNRKVEQVTHLVNVCGKGATRQAVIRVLQQLEQSGFGQFVTGRKGYDSRFVWKEV